MALFDMSDETQGSIGNVLGALGAGLLSGDRYTPVGPGFSQYLGNMQKGPPKAALKALLLQAGATPEQAETYSANEKVATLALASLKETKNSATLSGLVNSLPQDDGSAAPVSNLGMGRPQTSPAAPGGPAAGTSLNGNAATAFVDTLVGKESGGNPTAKNPNSSATGLTQFTDGTWRDMMRLHPDIGLTADGRTDPTQARAAAIAYAQDNAAELAKSGHEATPGNLYLGHFLGGPGATRFLNGLRQNPNAPAASYADPGSVSANRSVFFNSDGTPKSAQAFYNERTSKFGGAAPVRTADASGAVPAPSQAPTTTDTNPADLPALNAQPTGFTIPPGGKTAGQPALPGVTPTSDTAGTPSEQAEAAGVAKQAATVLQSPIPQSASPANQAAYAKRVKSWAERAIVAAPLLGDQGKGLSDLAKSRLDEANKVLSSQYQQPFVDAEGTTWQVGPDNQWHKINAAEKEPEAVRRLKEARANWKQYNLPDPNSTDPADQAVWRGMATKALTGVTTDITNNVGTSDEFKKGAAKSNVDRLDAMRGAGDASQAALGDLQRLKALSAAIGNPGQGAVFQKLVGPYLTALNIDSKGLSPLQQYNSVLQKIAPQMHVAGTGSQSDIEFKGAVASLGDPTMTQSARQAIIEGLEASHRYSIARAQIADAALNDEITPAEASKRLKSLPDPLKNFAAYKEAHPEEFPASDPAQARAPVEQPKPLTMTDRALSLRNARAALAKNPGARDMILQRLKDAGLPTDGL